MDEFIYYKNQLKNISGSSSLYKAAVKIDDDLSFDSEHLEIIKKVSCYIVGPVFFQFVLWVLHEAIEKGFKTLYFLARDGHIFYEIANKLVNQYNLDIECRYLYCSRIAFSIPTLNLNESEILDGIFIEGYSTTILTILERARLSNSEKNVVLNLIEYPVSKYDVVLTNEELMALKYTLSNCNEFMSMLREKSKKSYKEVMLYLEQEGIFKQNKIAIVDSGWMGSIQKMLERLINSQNANIQITGFYFGVFNTNYNEFSGLINGFYINKAKPLNRYLSFNNNLFECLCSYSDGMTIGYQITEEKVVPLLKERQNTPLIKWGINESTDIIIQYVNEITNTYDFTEYRYETALKLTDQLMLAFMDNPTLGVARVYGKIPFSDDSSEAYLKFLAVELNKQESTSLLIYSKIVKKISNSKIDYMNVKRFWLQGSIALSGNNAANKKWIKFNLKVWNYIRYVKDNWRKK